MELRLRVIEASGACPAVRAGKDRAVSVLFYNPLEFLCRQLKGFVPGHFNKRFFPSILSVAAITC